MKLLSMMLKTKFAQRLLLSLSLSYYAVLGLDPTVLLFESYKGYKDATLYCLGENMPSTASLEITKITPEGPVIIMEDPPKYTIIDEQALITLIIQPFVIDDAGDYMCTIRDDNVDWQHWPYKHLTINYTEELMIIDFPDLTTYDFDKGQDFKLYCNTTGFPEPKVWWEKKDNNEFRIEGPLLHLTSITADDIGTYYCIADNNIEGPVRKRVGIRTVFYAPEMTCDNTNLTSRQGWMVFVYLNCKVRANPPATVKWWKKTEEDMFRIIEDELKYSIYHIPTSEESPLGWYYEDSLWVMVTEPGDAGKYIATASNRLGTQEIEFTLTVV